MRRQFLIPILVGVLALGAAQAFAQSATVVLRNGDRIQAEVRDMGRNLNLRVNGAPRAIPVGDVVLIDFTGDGRNISAEELNRANSANGFVVCGIENSSTPAYRTSWEPFSPSFRTGVVSIREVSQRVFGSV